MECWVEHEYKHHIASVKLGFYNQFASLKLEPDLYISQPILLANICLSQIYRYLHVLSDVCPCENLEIIMHKNDAWVDL